MKIGFIGLGNVGGNVGGKLAGSLLRNGFDLTVRDLDTAAVRPLVEHGARTAASPAEMAASCDIVITCLPSPAASRAVLEAEDGVLAGLTAGTIWAEMSTTDEAEVRRLGALVRRKAANPPTARSRADATGRRPATSRSSRAASARPSNGWKAMGRRILHTGALGSASILKVVTNYLATANLVSLCEALATAKMAGMDLNTAYEAIRVSSGNSDETESQVILNGAATTIRGQQSQALRDGEARSNDKVRKPRIAPGCVGRACAIAGCLIPAPGWSTTSRKSRATRSRRDGHDAGWNRSPPAHLHKPT